MKAMVLLAGEQAAPNLLPARNFHPDEIYILHTDFWKSKLMADRLKMRLGEAEVKLYPIDAYDVGKITSQVSELLRSLGEALVNVTGGTKPMSMAALMAARETGQRPFYVRSQRSETEIDFYEFDERGMPKVADTITISDTITLDDYLVSYFGSQYEFTGYGRGKGVAFERAIHLALEPWVDEIGVGWKHESGAVDVDFVIRCNNQVGIIEAKTGGKARTTEGIKQLAVAGGQRFFGTYTRRFLVIDQRWPEKSNNRALAEAIGITLVELPSFHDQGELSQAETEELVGKVHDALGKPTRLERREP
ncbi:MAG: DUF1887 family protein [Chloroflexi bacterium]|nr:DUF1887 family protein [Chloroflexota bacterium]